VLAIRNVSEDAMKKATKKKEFEAVIERAVGAIEKIKKSAAGKVSEDVMKQMELRLRVLKQWQGNLKMQHKK
jgi:predicted AlkP superfamily phosphohydrolase/phosphomutase